MFKKVQMIFLKVNPFIHLDKYSNSLTFQFLCIDLESFDIIAIADCG